MVSVIERDSTTNPTVTYVQSEINNALLNINTIMPGRVIKYDKKKNRATIEPVFKIVLRYKVRINGQETNNIPIKPLTNVPVLYLGGKNMNVSFDLEENDRGIILFSQRSLEQWKQFLLNNTKEAPPPSHAPNTNRKFNLNDGMFLPCVIDTGGISEGADLLSALANTGLTSSDMLGGNRLRWQGKLDMGNNVLSMLQALQALRDEISTLNSDLRDLSTILISVLGALSFVAPPAAAKAVDVARVNVKQTALTATINANKLLLERVLK